MRRGEVLGLLGPNGSGKSTPVSMVTSLLEPSTGQVLFDGESIARAPLAYKARVGYVPDEAHLCSYLPDPSRAAQGRCDTPSRKRFTDGQ